MATTTQGAEVTSIRIHSQIQVRLIQNDMVGFEEELPHPEADEKALGKLPFTDLVDFGEIFIEDMSPRKMWWSGYVEDGQLHLVRSKGQSPSEKPRSGQRRPAMLARGKYRIWLDAWIHRDQYDQYREDPVFTKDGRYDDRPESRWKPVKFPPLSEWQEIEVFDPPIRGEPLRIEVVSRRYHWLYRIMRLTERLEEMLEPHDRVMAAVADVRSSADYLWTFLGALYMSGVNMVRLERDLHERLAQLRAMQDVLNGVRKASRELIDFGTGSDPEILKDRQRIANVASLLWRILEAPDFGRDMSRFDTHLAEEHRILLAGLGSVFNGIRRAGQGGRRFGRDFAGKFVLPWFDARANKMGLPPPFGYTKSSRDVVKWVDSTRKYAYSMLDKATVFVRGQDIAWDRLGFLLREEDTNLFARADELVKQYRKLGRSDVVERILRNHAMLASDEQRLLLADPTYKTLMKQLEDTRKEIEEITRRKPQPLSDGLKTSNPKAVYVLQGFELFAKALVARSAWNAFKDGATSRVGYWPERLDRIAKGASAGFSTIDVMGTLVRSLGFQKILTATFALELEGKLPDRVLAEVIARRIAIVSKLGKGLGAAADIGKAFVYGWNLFAHEYYRNTLTESYLPEDALNIRFWHLVHWAGKVVNARGAVMLLGKLSPIGWALQAVGAALEFGGELGAEMAKYGAAERKHFGEAYKRLTDASDWVSKLAATRGLAVDLHPASERKRMGDLIEQFKWMPVDPQELDAAMASTP